MKVKLFVALAIVSAVVVLLSLYVPWLLFTGLIRIVGYGTFEVAGSTYGLGTGTLSRTSAEVTVWSGEYWSSAGSDFWFGWLSIAGGLLALISLIGFMKGKKPLIPTLLVLTGGILSISASVLAIAYYRPQTFVVDGQIVDCPFQAGIVRATDATINIGMGPWLSLAGGALSIISITLAYYFRSKQKERKLCRE